MRDTAYLVASAYLAAAGDEAADLTGLLPDETLTDFFAAPFDYHNLKALCRRRYGGLPVTLSNRGRIEAEELRRAVESGALEDLPPQLSEAAQEGMAIMERTGSPRELDLTLDRFCVEEQRTLAGDSELLRGYVARRVESANLRTLGRLHPGTQAALLPGGETEEETLLAAFRESRLSALFSGTVFALAAKALEAGDAAALERQCRLAETAYFSEETLAPFGESVVALYLARQSAAGR